MSINLKTKLPMKKIFTLLLLFSFQFSKAQHYTQGVPFDTTLYSGFYAYTPGCSQTYLADISLDPSLYNYPDGLQFMLIMDSVSYPVPSTPPYQVGDTFIIDATHHFGVINPNVRFKFRIKLVGTPTTSGQVYPCQLALNQCTCLCFQMTIAADLGSQTCSVDLAQAIADNRKTGMMVYPNPAVNALSVNGAPGHVSLHLYDSFGKLVLEQEMDGNSTVNTANLTEGVYTLSIDDGKSKTFTKVLVSR